YLGGAGAWGRPGGSVSVPPGGTAPRVAAGTPRPTSDSYTRQFFLLDTFEGFHLPSLSADERAMVEKRYHYQPCLAEVTRTFSPFSFVKIIAGRVPETLSQV